MFGRRGPSNDVAKTSHPLAPLSPSTGVRGKWSPRVDRVSGVGFRPLTPGPSPPEYRGRGEQVGSTGSSQAIDERNLRGVAEVGDGLGDVGLRMADVADAFGGVGGLDREAEDMVEMADKIK